MVKAVTVGSTEGLAAAKRGECDLAPNHLMDPATSEYNKPFMTPGLELIRRLRRNEAKRRHGRNQFGILTMGRIPER